MGSIISPGLGSGLDVAGIVEKLVQAEGAPKTVQLNRQEAKVQAKLSALGTLRSALAKFRDTLSAISDLDKFQGRKVTSSKPELIAATATSSAVPGSFTVEVVQLARAHKVQSQPHPADTSIGTGTLTIAIGEDQFEVVIDEANASLAGIASSINASPAGARVQATVINGVDGAVLALSSRTTGEANAFTVSQTGDLAALVAGLDVVEQGRDAEALVDGVSVTSATNTLSEAIKGVELSLLAEGEDDTKTASVTIAYDRAAARKTIDDLVKAYNGVIDAVASVANYDAETRQGGPLFGDAGVRNIVQQLRRELSSAVAGLDSSFDTLNEIGISAQLDGKLTVDTARLDAAFEANFDAVGTLFASKDTGVAVRLDALLKPYLGSGGVLDARTASLKASIDDIGDQREALSRRLEGLHERYLRQFNALDGLLAQLQSTSNFLSQQLSRLPDIKLPD